MTFLQGMVSLHRNGSFWLLCIISLYSGIYNAWSGQLDSILPARTFSETDDGWFGFASTMATISGGLLFARIADLAWCRYRLKLLMCMCLGLSVLGYLWFTLSVPLPAFGADEAIIPSNRASTCAAISFAGFFLGGVNPLLFELAAEITFPVSEGR